MTEVTPGQLDWQRIDPKFLTVKRISLLIGWPIAFAVIPLILSLAAGWWWTWWVAAALTLVVVAWDWNRQRRWIARFAYAEAETDLWIVKGLMVRQQLLIPYGRMQAVTVKSGPLQRAFGLASVALVTASMESDAGIPGLRADLAAQLRDRLAERGASQQAGL